MSDIKPQTAKIVSRLRFGLQQENDQQDANKIQTNLIEHYDARDLRLQDLQDCQKVYKVIKKETTTKWILLTKLEECKQQIKIELQYLRKLVIYVQNHNKQGLNKSQMLEINQLSALLNLFQTYVDLFENNTYDRKDKLKRIKTVELEDKQKAINEWKKWINRNESFLEPIISESKQITLKVIEEVLTLSYDLKYQILQEPDTIDPEIRFKIQEGNQVLINTSEAEINLKNFNICNRLLSTISIDNFNYHIPKLQDMNQLNLSELKEMKRKLKNKSKTEINQMNSGKTSPKKEESVHQQNEVDNCLYQYQKEKQRISRVDKANYKQNIKDSQREVFIARNNQGSIQKLHQSFDINKLNTSKGHREYIISMIDGQLLKPYTPLARLKKDESREIFQNFRNNDSYSQKQSLRNVSPQTFVERISQKINDITTCEENEFHSKLEFPELQSQKQQGQINMDNRRGVKKQYNQKFIQQVNNNEVKLVKQCQGNNFQFYEDFYTTRMKFNNKFTELVTTLQKDRPLTSSIRSRSLTVNQNQRQENIQKVRKVAEKARQNFFLRNKEQRLWLQNLAQQYKLADSTIQHIIEQLSYIVQEGLFIKVDDIISMLKQIEDSSELTMTPKSCQLLNQIFVYFGIQISELNQHKKFRKFNTNLD
ncbi:unnamed protein product (macronuclear) [Paramecium tetraurelia]|uniref:Uncharacterized protein n=1 Tax=Paramecium tetraurelia TaxID=5888 RepID=A0CSM5_PARTE|nr:uncharacterized protein GSPATT00010064001 [Paramecium tetraurelia]CAK73792.1 unnamed protein product [Paramecium tetraurelia]|eukprot:XP_001441189.1 hypothetical protein (macronuclear) [Paramecium tetraurelia strain d4-2]